MNWVIGILIDLILLLIVVVCAKSGSKNGFAKTLVSFFGIFIAFILAVLLCKPIANGIYSGVIEKPVTSGIENAINKQIDDNVSGNLDSQQVILSVEEAIDKLPAFVKNAVNFEDKKTQLSTNMDEFKSQGVSEFSQKIADTVVKPAAITVLSVVSFIVILLIAAIVCAIIAKSLKLVNKIPLLGSLNAFLGGLLGVLKGIIIVLVINWALVLIVGDGGKLFSVITAETINSSIIMKNLTSLNPLNHLFEAFTVSK